MDGNSSVVEEGNYSVLFGGLKSSRVTPHSNNDTAVIQMWGFHSVFFYLLLIVRYRSTGADQVPITVNIVDTRNRWPILVCR